MTATDERPAIRTMLPIRVEAGVHAGRPTSFLCYEANIYRPNGYAKVPCKQVVDTAFTEAVLDCMKIFWDMENKIDQLRKEHDEALEDMNKARHENKLLVQKIGELDRRMKRAEEARKKAEDKIMES